MTTTAVSASRLLKICAQAKQRILGQISTVGGKVSDVLTEADLRSVLGPREVLGTLYKSLNFVLRLEELCEINEGAMPLGIVYVNLSLEDYTRLISYADPDKIYSVTNPYQTKY
jgi:hypothetical protein